MKKNNNQTDVLELEAEEIPLEKVIENSLVRANVTDAVIANLKEKYGNLRLNAIDDKESYLSIKEARKEVRKVGILTEKLCKKGREDAVAIQKKWLAKEDEILNKIAEVQNPLDAEIKRFDDEVERKELEEAKQREVVYMNRQAALSKLGATYNNGSFELKHISYEIELIKQADEEQWNDTILPKYKKVYEEIEAERVAEEEKRRLENERLQKERAEFEAQQKFFKEQQELFAKQQADLQKQKDEHERQQRLAQEKKDAEAKQKLQDRINNRYDQLYALGMKFNAQYGCFAFEDVNVDNSTEINLFNNEEWNALIEKITPVIEERKKVAEEKRLAKIAEDLERTNQLAAQQERERIENEQRQAEERKQHEAQQKAAEMELAGDKEKYAAVIGYLIVYPKHEMKSNIYKGKMNAIAQFIQNL